VGNPRYYERFGFRASTDYGITPADTRWDNNFQIRTLSTYNAMLHGAFTYAEPFNHDALIPVPALA
jgi:putative acetyltransferase